MSFQFSNPIVAGNILVRPAIQSPDFVSGASGWIVRRDGTAEFADLVARGDIVASEVEVPGPNDTLIRIRAGILEIFDAFASLALSIDGTASPLPDRRIELASFGGHLRWTFDDGTGTTAAELTSAGDLTLDANDRLDLIGANEVAINGIAVNGLVEAWPAFLPQVDQGTPAVAYTATWSKVRDVGSLVLMACRLDFTGAGTAGSPIEIELPRLADADQVGFVVGTYLYFDADAAIGKAAGPVRILTTQTVDLTNAGATSHGAAPFFAIAAGDVLSFTIAYEPA